MRYIVILGSILIAAVVVLVTAKGQQRQADVSKAFMRIKLTHSQKVLEGVTLKDFAMIAKHAEQLKALSFDASWQTIQTMEYVRHSEEFRRAADRLANAADEENLEAGLLAYFRLTQNCVDCHEHVRDQR